MPTDADAVADLAELAGGFIHDLKNHLSTLGLNLQLMAEDFSEPRDQRERRALSRVHRLQSECARLTDLANDFLRYARTQELDFQSAGVGDVIDEMADYVFPLAVEANVRLHPHLAPELPRVLLDREMFKQAMLNLLLNAIQAMPEGGDLTLQARPDRGGVAIDVIDTGVGMTPEALAKIFRPFHTTKPGGTGLGLPMARRVVRAHGGRLDVESEPGRGTRFTVWLPNESLLPATVRPIPVGPIVRPDAAEWAGG